MDERTAAVRAHALQVLDETAPKDRKSAPVYPERMHNFLKLFQMETVELEADGYAYKLYVHTANNRTANCPVHINIHGGGFYFPHAENDDMYCAWLADQIAGIVVDVDYTCSGEAPYPVAFDQCYEAAKWTFASCEGWDADANRVSMGGYSAGGTFTAYCTIKAAMTGDFKLCLQVLAYPPIDFAVPGWYKQEGFNGSANWLRRGEAFNDLFFGNMLPEHAHDPLVSPFYADDDVLAKQPTTLVLPAATCTFRFENLEYARLLARHGVEVTMCCVPGTRHGFIPHFYDGWEEAATLIVDAVRKASL